MPTRRSLLGSICATAALATAGCSGGGGDGSDDDSGDDGSTQEETGQSNDDGQSSNGGEWEYDGDPEDVPGEEQAKGIVDAYLLAITQGDPDAFNTVVHPDSPFAGAFTDEDIEQAGNYLNYYYRNMTVTELDQEEGRAVVEYELAIETSDGQEQTETSQELRVHEGVWRIWLTAPPEGSQDGN
jgi:hypothetical protein